MGSLNVIQKIIVWALPVLFAITVHEVSHGWIARHFGDRTAQMLGRLTLNPVKHVDPVGTLLIPAMTLLFGGFAFGWAKPVPVDWRNLRNPRRDMAFVALAGPVANLLMGVGWALVARAAIAWHPLLGPLALPLVYMAVAGTVINSVLMVLNMLPIPPLDGSRVVAALLPPRMAWRYAQLERWGLIIIIALFMTHALDYVLFPILDPVLSQLAAVAGISTGVFSSILSVIS